MVNECRFVSSKTGYFTVKACVDMCAVHIQHNKETNARCINIEKETIRQVNLILFILPFVAEHFFLIPSQKNTLSICSEFDSYSRIVPGEHALSFCTSVCLHSLFSPSLYALYLRPWFNETNKHLHLLDLNYGKGGLHIRLCRIDIVQDLSFVKPPVKFV